MAIRISTFDARWKKSDSYHRIGHRLNFPRGRTCRRFSNCRSYLSDVTLLNYTIVVAATVSFRERFNIHASDVPPLTLFRSLVT